MAKIAFTKLGLTKAAESAVKTVEINGQTIEVKQYLPINDKLELIAKVLNQSADDNNFANPIKLDVFTSLEIIFAYTNISFTEKQKEDLVKLYDLLKGSGLMDAVIDAIGFDNEEYYDSYRGCKGTANEIMTKKQSARGIMEDIVANYSDMSFETAEMQKNIADPNNLALLKDIMTKLG